MAVVCARAVGRGGGRCGCGVKRDAGMTGENGESEESWLILCDLGWCWKQSYESIEIRHQETEEGDSVRVEAYDCRDGEKIIEG